MSREVYSEIRPLLDIVVAPEGGDKVRLDLSGIVTAMSFVDEERKADRLTIEVDNFDGGAWDTAIFAKGNMLYTSWGYAGFMAPTRQMVITKSSGGITLTVEAKDRSLLMHRETKTETYEDVRRSDVVALIASRNGFGPGARVIEETPTIHETITQPNVSDVRMLRNLAQKQGFEFFIGPDGLHWHSRDLAQAPSRRFVYYPAGRAGADFNNRNAMWDYAIENDLTAKPAKTKLKGIDPDTKQPIVAEGSNAATERDQLQEIVEVRDYDTGTWQQVTRAVLEETKPTAETTQEAAKERADGRFKKISQRAVKLSFSCLGDPLLLAKTLCDVEGIAQRVDGRYYLEKVEHSINESGYTCRVTAITDGTNAAVSLTDALFPEQTSGRNDALGLAAAAVAVLQDAARQLGAAGDFVAKTATGKDLSDLADQIAADPENAQLLDAAASAGKQLQSVPGLDAVGTAVKKAGKIAADQGRSARGKGRRNVHPTPAGDEDDKLEPRDVEDDDGEFREWR